MYLHDGQALVWGKMGIVRTKRNDCRSGRKAAVSVANTGGPRRTLQYEKSKRAGWMTLRGRTVLMIFVSFGK